MAHEEVAPLNTEGDSIFRVTNSLMDCFDELGRHALVSIDIEDPSVLELDVAKTPVLVRCPVIERSLGDFGTKLRSNLDREIGAAGIVDVHIVRPRHTLKATR